MSIIRKLTRLFPDSLYLRLMFYYHMKKRLNLNKPTTFNEKLQWLKINDRRNDYVKMVDKIEAKEHFGSIIGKEYIIPTIKIWDNADDISFEKLPNQFVIKSNHDSKGVIVCKNKNEVDVDEVKSFFNKRLRTNGFWYGREWPYKYVKPRVFAERFMTNNENSEEFTDYKFFCFNGYVDCVMVSFGRSSEDTKFYFFDKDWKLKRYNNRGMTASPDFTLDKPRCMDKMFEIASKLSVGVPFVRIDLYQSDDKIFFGEFTLYPASGYDSNYLRKTDEYFGSLIDLSTAKSEF